VCEVPQGDGDTLSFGAYLKRSRALRELSAEQVARLTRLPLRIVTALEAEDWQALQDRRHALFVARSCASAIGLDPDETALRLEEELQLSVPPLPQRTPLWKRLWRSRPREPAVWIVLCLTAAACLSVLLFRR
jgi:cytoskeletal protein RodZ